MIGAGFRAAILDPALPVPEGLHDPQGRPAGRRFAVYRNTVAVSLTEALAEGFPVLRRLLGAEFFDAMAGIFLRRHPPRSPMLWQYGAEMPAFLRGFAPVAHLPYLPDVARLEQCLRESYHAADALPLDPAALTALAPERLAAGRLRLAPALRLVQSDWPVHAIWQAHSGGPPPRMSAEAVVVLRPEFDPAPRLLPPGGGAFVDALLSGSTLAGAIDEGGPGHALDATLAILLGGGGIVGFDKVTP